MEKTNEARQGKTPCDECSEPATVTVDGHFYCVTHAPSTIVGEKRAGAHPETIKNSIESLVDLHNVG